MPVRSLSQEDPLEDEIAPHSSNLAYKIPWWKSLAGYSPWGHKKSYMTEHHKGSYKNGAVFCFVFM